ncbi:MAG: hypothetical protein AAF290_02115 [Pseudomonadota bacterium]
MTSKQDAALERFDSDLTAWMQSASEASEVARAAVMRQIRWQRRLRLMVPAVALLLATVLVGPVVWRLTIAVSGQFAVDWVSLADPQQWVSALRQVPPLIWAPVALTIGGVFAGFSSR